MRVVSYAAILSTAATLATADCYWANGNKAANNSNYVPCDPTARISQCCLSGEVCLANGLCYGNLGVNYRGGCTDPDWPAGSICASRRYCAQQDRWANLIRCNSTAYWCGSTGIECVTNDGANQIFAWPLGRVLWVANSTQTAADSTTAISSSGANASAANTSVSRPVCDKDKNTVSQGTAIAVGVGLGIPLLFALGGLGFLLSKESRAKRKPRTPMSYPPDEKRVEISYQPITSYLPGNQAPWAVGELPGNTAPSEVHGHSAVDERK